MKIFVLIGILLSAGLLMVQTAGFSQEDMTAVDAGVFESPRRPAAVFPHDAHNEKAKIEDCAVCHHLYKDGKRVDGESSEDQRCSECHKLEAVGGQPGLMKAFHLNCKGCHMEKKAGPILCGECHKN